MYSRVHVGPGRQVIVALGVAVILICGSAVDLSAADVQGKSPPLNLWIISSRHCPLGTKVIQGTTFDYLKCHRNGKLSVVDEKKFHDSLVPGAPVCMVVHGSFVNWNDVATDGLLTAAWLRSAKPNRPLNVVVFSWKSTGPFTLATPRLIFTPLPQIDAGVLGRRSAFAGLYLARLITDLPAGHSVSLFGHSHGSRTVVAGLHVLAGGQIQGYVLADPPKQKRRMRAVLAAAAMDHHWLNPDQRYGRALESAESLVNLRNHRDTVLRIYPLRHPFSNRALAIAGFTAQDRMVMGKRSNRASEIDVSRVVGTLHGWAAYYTRPVISRSIAEQVHFLEKKSGTATSIEDATRETSFR